MLTTAIIFILVLGLLVLVHELGHFFTARYFGVKAEEFGFGFPPRVCGWRKVNGRRKFFWGNQDISKIQSEDTVLSFNWLPIGGFVNIKGENGDGHDADSFGVKKAWQRVIILSAGVIMNFVLAFVLLSAALMLGAPQAINGQDTGADVADAQIQILQVVKDSPAQAAGLQIGDVILALNEQPINNTNEVSEYFADKNEQPVVMKINHFGEIQEKTVTPSSNNEAGAPQIGVALIKSGIVSYPWYQAIWLGAKATVIMTGQILVGFGTLIKGLFVGLPAGIDVAGPVGIAVMTGQVAKLGLVYLLQFAALLSINLAIINFLPFPGLDGGRVAFILLEKARRKRVDQKTEQIVHTTGFLLLIVLIIVVTGRDLFKFREVFFNIFNRIFG